MEVRYESGQCLAINMLVLKFKLIQLIYPLGGGIFISHFVVPKAVWLAPAAFVLCDDISHLYASRKAFTVLVSQ
jgi:hypothetical protein